MERDFDVLRENFEKHRSGKKLDIVDTYIVEDMLHIYKIIWSALWQCEDAVEIHKFFNILSKTLLLKNQWWFEILIHQNLIKL